jgi:hypothetical protein
MRYQQVLGIDELKKWLRIEVSLGTNQKLIDDDKARLLTFFKSFSDFESKDLERIASYKISANTTELSINKSTVRLLLLKRFIDGNKPSIIGELLGTTLQGRELEKYIFLKLADTIFSKSSLPEDIYAYCTFRRRGSPTTWLKINNDLTGDQLKLKINDRINSLCNRLTRRLHNARKLRMFQSVRNLVIYLIEKPAGIEVVKTEENNQEAQKASYSLLVLDIQDKKIGYVSGSKKEIFDVQTYIKEVLFPEQVFTPRNDLKYDAKELFKKILLIDAENANLEIAGLTIVKVNLPNNPTLKLESSDGTSIQLAIAQIENLWRGLDISSIKHVDYLLSGQKVGLYSYGDDWKRRCLNVVSRGKSILLEENLLRELKNVLSAEIKESRFITEELSIDFIVNKLLKDKIVSVDPPIPEAVEKIIVELVAKGLLKKPKKVAKRRCENWDCKTVSWTNWNCPACGRAMIVVGESITIGVAEAKLMKHLSEFLSSNFTGYEIVRQTIQRKKYKKTVIRLVNKIKDVAVYIIPVFSKKDLNFSEFLAMEGYGLLTLCDPNMASKREILEASGCSFLELASVVTEIKKSLDNQQNDLKNKLVDSICLQENNMLARVYKQLQESEKTLREKSNGYDEDQFEIDIKNIIQALVPNVVRLGTKFKGKSVPDGYCSFKSKGNNLHNLFGWDAKYSFSNNYTLNSRDLVKQQNYFKWLRNNPEPKSLGKLRIYSLISNFVNIRGFTRVLTALRKSKEKPWRCKVVLIHDSLISRLASWMLNNWKKVVEHGPAISEIFFTWLTDKDRNKRSRWIYCTSEDWTSLVSELNAL